jgi:hypothetical protein
MSRIGANICGRRKAWQGGSVKKNIFTESIAACCSLIIMLSAAAFAQGPSSTRSPALDTGQHDLQQSHNEMASVTVGAEVTFQRYVLVKVLDQYFTVAADGPGDVLYDLQNNGNEKVLIIY